MTDADKAALAWAERQSNDNPFYATLAALVRRQDAEINALHSDGMTIYAMMNDERVSKLEAENAELRQQLEGLMLAYQLATDTKTPEEIIAAYEAAKE